MSDHPTVLRPESRAAYDPEKMGKATLFSTERLLVGLNGFEPGQSHALHTHEKMDKMYQVLEGEGRFLLEDQEIPIEAGMLLTAPAGVPHGLRNTGEDRLLVLAVLAPGP